VINLKRAPAAVTRHCFDTLATDLVPVAELLSIRLPTLVSPADARGGLTLSKGRTGKRGLFRKQRNKRGMQ
jgi:hypothetical protein